MDLGRLARSTHTLVRAQELWLNPVEVLWDLGRFQLRQSRCAAFLQGFGVCTVGFLVVERAAANHKLPAIHLPVSPSIFAAVFLGKFGMQPVAQWHDATWVGPLGEKSARFP